MKINLPITGRSVDFAPDANILSTTDLDSTITYANPDFIQVSGYELSELLGSPHNLLRHPDMPAAAFRDLWETVQAGRQWHGYVKNLRKDGGHYWVYATVVPNVRDGKIVGFTSVRREPSREKVAAAEAQYQEMRGS